MAAPTPQSSVTQVDPVTQSSFDTSGDTIGVANPVLDPETLAEQYGFTSALLNSNGELKDLFSQAVSGGWTPDKFQAKLRDTDWWKSMSDTERKSLLMQYNDPAAYGQLWHNTQEHVKVLIGQMGGDVNNWDLINSVSGNIISKGWNDEMANQSIGQFVTFGTDGLAGGKAGSTQMDINSYAYSMGVKNSDQWMQDAVRKIMQGQATEQDYKNQIMDQSVAAFPAWEKQIRSGMTLQDVAQPYMQSMSQILEIAPGQVNLFDPTIRGALSWKDSTGQQSSKPLWQFQNDLRQDPRWNQTQNAQDATMGAAHKILQDFGKAF